MKFTKKSIEKLVLPDAKKPYYKIFRDDHLKGFALRVTSEGRKTFILDKKIQGKLVRVTLGQFGEMTVDQARQTCQKLIGRYLAGEKPPAKTKADASGSTASLTLAHVLEDYLKARKTLKPRSILDYRSTVYCHLTPWLNQPITQITKETVVQLHTKIGKRSEANANKTMRVLRALFNFAMVNYEDSQGKSQVEYNPVLRLSLTRAWYPRQIRRRKIEISELLQWFQAVNTLQNNGLNSIAYTVKHYLILLLFTGLRRQEAIQLIWSDRLANKRLTKEASILDINNRVLFIPDPKNRQPHCLPLTDYLIELFTHYKQHTQSLYVFPNARGNHHIIEPRKVMKQVTQMSGIVFNLHDLRRTFASIAESLDIPAYALKRLLNHSITSDVTAGYIVTDAERLRKPMQQITDYILSIVQA